MIIAGIDPGLDGGIAWILQSSETMTMKMPVVSKRTKAKTERRLDTKLLISELLGTNLVVIERQQAMPKQGVASTFKIGKNYGILLGILAAMEIPFQEVRPQEWKNSVLKGTKKDKGAAIEFCQRRYPEAKLVPIGCRVPHDGLADALCLAHYGKGLV